MKIRYLLAKIIKKIHLSAIINSTINKKSKICSGSHFVLSKLGKYSYVGNFCTGINAEIGNFCSIADNCIIGGASHPLDWVSTSPVFHKGKNVLRKNFSEHEYVAAKQTMIGSDVWIGNNSLIKSGIKIGHGAVIGMGSVLTKDVGDYEIWAGNPAKLIRKRFDDEVISRLLESKWWDDGDVKISQNANYITKPKEFIMTNR